MSSKFYLLLLFLLLPFFCGAQYTKIKNGVWKGTASYYHNMFEGRKTANGDIFRQKKLTGANNFLKLGTYVRVTNIKNGRSIVVKVNDRMNKRMKRLIDLSRESARQLGFINAGLAQVRMEVIGNPNKKVIAKKKKVPSAKKIAYQKPKAATVKKIPYVSKKKVAYQAPKAKKTKVGIKEIPYVTKNKVAYQKPKPKMSKVGIQPIPYVIKKKVAYQKPKPKKKVVKKKVIAYQKPKPKKATKAVAIAVPKKTQKDLLAQNASVRKVSRYSNSKKQTHSKQKKQAILSWASPSDRNWNNTVSYYKESYAKESAFIEGGALSFLDSGQILKSFLRPSSSTEYAFVLLSKKLQSPKDFMIEAIDSVTLESNKDEILFEQTPKFSEKGNHYIYYFTYTIPEGTEFLRFTLNGVDYENAKSEDFALFIFDE